MAVAIDKSEVSKWIRNVGKDGLMLTISEPHGKCHHLGIKEEHMAPVIDNIIGIANGLVLPKHRRSECLTGVVVVEGIEDESIPHYHIVFSKPEKIEFDVFERKLTKVSNLFCSERFRFDLTDAPLSKEHKYFLSNPCYSKFAKVTPCHSFTGEYLTKKAARYYLLSRRGFDIRNDKLGLYMDYRN